MNQVLKGTPGVVPAVGGHPAVAGPAAGEGEVGGEAGDEGHGLRQHVPGHLRLLEQGQGIKQGLDKLVAGTRKWVNKFLSK